jgi:hypothetical protein
MARRPVTVATPPEVVDLVNHPPHYNQGSIECIDAMEAMLGREAFIAYLRGTVFRYNWRLLHKDNPVQDAQKMAWYQDRLIKTLEQG